MCMYVNVCVNVHVYMCACVCIYVCMCECECVCFGGRLDLTQMFLPLLTMFILPLQILCVKKLCTLGY